ncbi:MAG: hypothetical protein JO189_16750, partial [Deltaproteobacteria bacterium]|nr:hypothetical protein [Deltaproteobacteria bacterium]
AIAVKLAGTKQIELNKVYGNVKTGTAVEAIEVPRVDHFRILFSDEAANEILNWCDLLFGLTPPAVRDLKDPRMQTQLIVFASFIVLLVPLGLGLGAISPLREHRLTVGAAGWQGLVGLAAVLVASLPLVSTYVPGQFLALDTGDILISWLSVAGLGIISVLAVTDNLRWVKLWKDLDATLLTVLIGVALIYAIQVPRDVTLHNLSFTPERLIAFLFSTLLLVPFFLGFEILVRRGRPRMSPVLGTIGRIIVIFVLIVGLEARIIPPLVSLLLPILVIFMVESEIVSAGVYARSGNVVTAALIESAWLAWMISATMPVTMML